ncbi:pseudouridine synthase [Petrotoga sp. 9PWA.NaAc.5.4]|uniref:pseudouridine synthase n=1 Tax=Petrotoga sp. 9PWA.NaAc.5.4 TaxID=1434328 RepID=UPI000CC5D79C|nr:pseudouridine synthase [Petrotoga sp. 9PWA.NaAc.5.4]PNR95954.1 ribosomal large subunit pseudouridine synthase B [Petrotoga sp. 9PWA.NaAc.5.4]
MNLQKALQILSLSRRKSSEYIFNKGIKVNGILIKKPWYELKDNDLIEFENQIYKVSEILKITQNKVYYLFNKPKNVLCTFKDNFGRTTIQDLIKDKIKERVFYVGRLDYDAQGVLLLTNDGNLANYLLRPENKVVKIYHVLIDGIPSKEDLLKLENGIVLEDGYKTLKAHVSLIKKMEKLSLIKINIHEGKKRQIKLMFKALGFSVLELTRVKFGPWGIEIVPHPGDIKKIDIKYDLPNKAMRTQ